MGINYSEIAKCIASASKDPRYKVGAVIFDNDDIIVSTGYNGAPRGVEDTLARYAKPLKQYYIAHAEINAIAQAARKGVSTLGCSIIIWGKPPCANCAMAIIQAGIKTVLFQAEDFRGSKYYESFIAAFKMFEEAGIDVQYLKPEEVC